MDKSLKYQMIRPFADIEGIESFIALFLQSEVFIAPGLSKAGHAIGDRPALFAKID
jgi:hypothetical protein